MNRLSREEFSELIGGFRESLFRLEAKQHYAISDYDERFRAFREGRALPPSDRKADWVRRVAAATAAGRRIYRVHVINTPLTEYLRYEFAVYPETIPAGEEISIADRAWHPDLGALTEDFVIVDDRTVVWYRYDPDGRLLGYDRGSDEDLVRCRRQRDIAIDHAVSLEDYLANGQNGERATA